jgi:hypothetical protein
MKADCSYYDDCDMKFLSECCGALIYTDTDICSECREHCGDACEDCPDYKTEKDESGKTE